MSATAWIGVAVALVAGAIVAWSARVLRTRESALPPELTGRRTELRSSVRELVAAVPAAPVVSAVELPAHPASVEVESRLMVGDGPGALAQAEAAVAANPGDGGAQLLLARALVATADFPAAQSVLERARALGVAGPLAAYLAGRVRHGLAERAAEDAGSSTGVSPLITRFEMFILQLEQQRRVSEQAAAVWLASAAGESHTLSHDQIRELVVGHFTAYYDALACFVDAAREHPGFADALYHAARLALKVGFIEEGRGLLEAVEPLMAGSGERVFYQRDLAALRDEPELLTARAQPEIGVKAVRAKSLKVLNG